MARLEIGISKEPVPTDGSCTRSVLAPAPAAKGDLTQPIEVTLLELDKGRRAPTHRNCIEVETRIFQMVKNIQIGSV